MNKIAKIDTIDNRPGDPDGWGGDWTQGTEWTNWDIYKIETDLDVVYIKVGKVFNSYGEQSGSTEPQICSPVTKVINTWE